jgi:hypothetical protein
VVFNTISAPRRSRYLGIKTGISVRGLAETVKKAILTTLRFIVDDTAYGGERSCNKGGKSGLINILDLLLFFFTLTMAGLWFDFYVYTYIYIYTYMILYTYKVVFFDSGRGNKITFNRGDDNGTIGLWVWFEGICEWGRG